MGTCSADNKIKKIPILWAQSGYGITPAYLNSCQVKMESKKMVIRTAGAMTAQQNFQKIIG